MASSSQISSKGQIVIPVKLRKELGLKPGVRVIFAEYPLEKDLAEERLKWEQPLQAL